LLEKQGQLRPGDILVRAETGQIVHAGARFETERQANPLRFIKEKSWLTRVPRRGALNKPY
jgi:hypothetical protein